MEEPTVAELSATVSALRSEMAVMRAGYEERIAQLEAVKCGVADPGRLT